MYVFVYLFIHAMYAIDTGHSSDCCQYMKARKTGCARANRFYTYQNENTHTQIHKHPQAAIMRVCTQKVYIHICSMVRFDARARVNKELFLHIIHNRRMFI